MKVTDFVTKLIVSIVCVILSGWFVWILTPEWEETARKKGWVSVAEWQAKARQENWIPQEECPANPVKLRIISPGDNSKVPFVEVVEFRDAICRLETDVIVNTSKPIPKTQRIGLIFHLDRDNNYYVVFPFSNVSADRKNYTDSYIKLPFDAKKFNKVALWAILVDDKNSIDSIYSHLDQITNLPSVGAISKPI